MVKAALDYADLSCANLEGSNLRRASFIEATLAKARLEAADLRGVDFSDADLRGAVLARSSLEGAFFDGTQLSGADLRGATGLETLKRCRIDIGGPDQPDIHDGESARQWLLDAARA
jgi:uncharacterized protein YjbI with pentapeptide repeats